MKRMERNGNVDGVFIYLFIFCIFTKRIAIVATRVSSFTMYAIVNSMILKTISDFYRFSRFVFLNHINVVDKARRRGLLSPGVNERYLITLRV